MPDSPMRHRLATEAEVASSGEFFPKVAAGFEAAGFRRAGHVIEDLDPDEFEKVADGYEPRAGQLWRDNAGRPDTALTDSTGTTIALVGWWWETPAAELFSVSADGRLVSTRSAWKVDPPWPVAIQAQYRHTDRRREQLYDARPGRSIEIVDTIEPAQLWAAHQAHLAKVGGIPAQLSLQHLCRVRTAAYALTWRDVHRVNRITNTLAVIAIVAGIGLGGVVGGLLDSGWLGLLVAVVAAIAGFMLVGRLHWKLRHLPALRTPLPPVGTASP
jgi:hypothetical protein